MTVRIAGPQQVINVVTQFGQGRPMLRQYCSPLHEPRPVQRFVGLWGTETAHTPTFCSPRTNDSQAQFLLRKGLTTSDP
jgi:hypothetical protein